MQLPEIKAAVESGQSVHWASEIYVVEKDTLGQWLIRCILNDSCVGLTHRDGTLSDEPRMFYAAN